MEYLIPTDWKMANITSKNDKSIENIKPINLTSEVKKRLETEILNKISNYLEVTH